MFTRNKSINNTSNNSSPDKFIDNSTGVDDLANSQLLVMLDEEKNRESYYISKYENRVDLISKDIYGDEKYSWILLYINRMSIGDLTIGESIQYIPLATLNSIFNRI